MGVEGELSNNGERTMRRKLIVWTQRHRRSLTVIIYALMLSVLAVLAFDPSVLDAVLGKFIGGGGAGGRSVVQADGDDLRKADSAVSRAQPSVVVRKVFDLPFVPQRDFLCDEMHLKSGRNFTYPEGYMDHADAYKSALTLNDIIEEASPNEQSWILQDLAQLPFARVACETGFNAGHNAFHLLTANYDLILHSFETGQNSVAVVKSDQDKRRYEIGSETGTKKTTDLFRTLEMVEAGSGNFVKLNNVRIDSQREVQCHHLVLLQDLRRHNYSMEMTDFMTIEFPDRFFVYEGEPRQAIAKFTSQYANRTSCDVMIVDGSQPRSVVRDYFRLFRELASRRDNVVVMNAHPKNVHRSLHGADAVWDELRHSGLLVEQFRCYFDASDSMPNQKGLLVGSFIF